MQLGTAYRMKYMVHMQHSTHMQAEQYVLIRVCPHACAHSFAHVYTHVYTHALSTTNPAVDGLWQHSFLWLDKACGMQVASAKAVHEAELQKWR